jgi:F-type H+-transporting ATPase subunit delta
MAASAQTLARPYARAAFELAQSQSALPAWLQKLQLAATLSADSKIAALIANPKLSTTDRIALLLPEAEAKDSAFTQFMGVLADNDRLPALPQICALYTQHKADAERTLQVRVISAAAIDADQQEQLKVVLARRFNRSVSLVISLDPQLIGGAVIDTGEQVIDGSLKGKLSRLHAELAA